MHTETAALVLRETAYKDYDKMLSILTPAHGKLSVLVRGARRSGSPHMASTQLLAHSNFVLFSMKERYQLDDSESINLFFSLRRDIKAFSLGAYFAELLDAVCAEEVPHEEIFELALWGCEALGKRPLPLVKAAFELRLMALSGFEPDLDEHKRFFKVTAGALDAMRHILSSELGRACSFTLDSRDTNVLSSACEGYVLSQVERSFSSLEYYRSIGGAV